MIAIEIASYLLILSTPMIIVYLTSKEHDHE
jgi:hypothetical protein